LRSSVNVLAACLLVICLLCFVHSAFASTRQEALDQVSEADQALRTAFNSVSDAEHSGADVSLSLTNLTDAASLLSKAEGALKAGNYSDAVTDAGACKSLANGVAVDAVALKNDAVAASSSWWVTVVLSAVASVIFVGVLFLVWRWLRRGYVKKMLGSRPEVTG
jgi:hypothetical protein